MKLENKFDSDHQLAKKIVATLKQLSETLGRSDCLATQMIARGKIREIAQQYQQAAISYQEALRHSPTDLEALARLSLVRLKTGEINEGLTLARSLVAKDSNLIFNTITGLTISSMAVLGDALRLNGEVSSAAESYEKSIRLSEGKDVYSAARYAAIKVEEGDLNAATATIKGFDQSAAELSGISATVELLRNDPGKLPAINGILDNAISLIAADMAA